MILENIRGIFLIVMCALLVTATPSYAGSDDDDMEWAPPANPDAQRNRERQPANIEHVKIASRDVGAVDFYGDGTLMIEVPASSGQKTATTIPEAINHLIRTAIRSKSQAVEQSEDAIIVKSTAPAQPFPKRRKVSLLHP